jgi:membrane carboxypeptidase/penicillin-binding protein
MKAAGRIDPKADFDPPPNVVFTAVDYETGLKATPSSPRPILEAFVSGSQPTEEWNQHWEEITRLPWSLQRQYYMPKRGESLDDLDNPAAPPTTPSPGPAAPR